MVKELGKMPRNFGRRGTLSVMGLAAWRVYGSQRPGEATVYQKHRSVRSRKTMYTD